jgi:exodeoxyribonuclease-3
VLTRTALPGDPADAQSRYIEAAVSGVLIGCLYAPNGNPQPGPKFDYKLAWNERLIAHAAALQATGAPVVLAGDYNIVPTPADIYPSKSWSKNALVQPEPRAQYARLLASGWTDALLALTRRRAPTPSGPTCAKAGRATQACAWTTCCSAKASGRAATRRGPRIRATHASDHAPAWIALREADAVKRRRNSAAHARSARHRWRTKNGSPASASGAGPLRPHGERTRLPHRRARLRVGRQVHMMRFMGSALARMASSRSGESVEQPLGGRLGPSAVT